MSVNLRDYSRTPAQRGWGPGWPSCQGAKAAGTAVVTADRSGTRMSVHKRVARLVDLLVDETERRGYLLIPGQCGAYNCRAIGGTSSPSIHSWALATDLNWSDNPYTTDLRKRTIPDWTVALWNRYGFAWGGHYSGARKDFMHLEFMGTPEQADEMTALALRELAGGTPPVAPPKPLPAPNPSSARPPTLRRGDTGPYVEVLHRFLGVARAGEPGYGEYGPATHAAVVKYQKMRGIPADGVVGPVTWREMGLT